MKKIKLGFIGAGFMGQLAHLSNYAQLDECEVVAVADAKFEQAKKVARKYNVPNVYKTPEEIINIKDIDGIVTSQIFSNHINIVPPILKAGKNVLTEKPISITPECGKMLSDLALKKNLIYMVGYHKRSDPAVEYGKKIIREWKQTGEFGKMTYIRITMPPGDWLGGAPKSISTNEPYPAAKQEELPEEFNNGQGKAYMSFVNYYIHQVNMMRHLLDEEYKLTFADKSQILLAVESVSGVCGIIEMQPYNNSHDWQEKILVCFENGYIKISLPAPLAAQRAGSVTIMKDDGKDAGSFFSPIFPNISAMRNQASNYIKALRGERKPPCSSQEAVKDLEVAKDYIRMLYK